MIPHSFRSPLGGLSFCGVRAFWDGEIVSIMLIELGRSGGSSLASCFEDVATTLVPGIGEARLLIDPALVRWLALHPESPIGSTNLEGPLSIDGMLDEVKMRWNGERYDDPDWYPFERAPQDLGKDITRSLFGSVQFRMLRKA